jgi:hypothetical protein
MSEKPSWVLPRDKDALLAYLEGLETQLETAQRERDEAWRQLDNAKKIGWELQAENRALRAFGESMTLYLPGWAKQEFAEIAAPLTAAEVERVKGLEQDNAKLHEDYRIQVDAIVKLQEANRGLRNRAIQFARAYVREQCKGEAPTDEQLFAAYPDLAALAPAGEGEGL